MRAEKHVVPPDEDADEFAGLEAAMITELAPVGALQTVLARRVAIATCRLARADRIEADLFAERHLPGGGPGLALIRDGNGTRSFETLLRYRGAAMAEFWRALRTLKALQAEQAAGTGDALAEHPMQPAARPLVHLAQPNEPERSATLAHHSQPDEPERGAALRLDYLMAEPAAPARGAMGAERTRAGVRDPVGTGAAGRAL
jgi:hypothetical protein